jgi:hypothetical protein
MKGMNSQNSTKNYCVKASDGSVHVNFNEIAPHDENIHACVLAPVATI